MKYETHRLLDHAVEADDRDLAEVISNVVTHLAWECYMILVTFGRPRDDDVLRGVAPRVIARRVRTCGLTGQSAGNRMPRNAGACTAVRAGCLGAHRVATLAETADGGQRARVRLLNHPLSSTIIGSSSHRLT